MDYSKYCLHIRISINMRTYSTYNMCIVHMCIHVVNDLLRGGTQVYIFNVTHVFIFLGKIFVI